MFFKDHEKLIYSPEGADQKFDPLALDRVFRRESNNQFAKLIETWKAPDLDEGDISQEGRLKTTLAADAAEEELARISRIAFNLNPFPESTDGQALEYMCQYLDWCKKKETQDTTSQDSTTSVPTNLKHYVTKT
jgi:hypothetical protein